MDNKITVRAQKSFGRTDFYPANDLAKAFCELLGKPNLPLDAIIKLRKLGYQVDEQLKATI